MLLPEWATQLGSGWPPVSSLILQPATWPHLNLNPEPIGNSMDPDSIERWYQELFRDHLMPYQVIEEPTASNHAYLNNRMKKCPASAPHRRP